jgi:sulfopyruvate decarboxylase subunit alpha
MGMPPQEFVDELLERGFDFFSGVPCSLIKNTLSALREQDRAPYIPAAREDSALGIAAGAAMGGKRPVVLMQNSGLGVSINALISLHDVYEIPCLLLITWRGYQGQDEPEHIVMGPVMPQVLDTFNIPHRTLEPEGDAADYRSALDWAQETMRQTSKPCALLVRKGALG